MNLPSHFLSDLVVVFVFGVVAILLLCGSVKAWDLMTRKIDEEKELNSGNYAVAIVLSVYMLSVAYIIGKVITHVLGS